MTNEWYTHTCSLFPYSKNKKRVPYDPISSICLSLNLDKALIYRSIQAFLSSGAPQHGACSNVFTAEPGTCEVRKKQRDEVGHMQLDIVSSWLNTVRRVEPFADAIFQNSHTHIVMEESTGISGVHVFLRY